MNLNPTLFDTLSARVNLYVNRWLTEELDTAASLNQIVSDAAKERLAKLKVIVNDIKVNTLYLKVASALDLATLEETLRSDNYTKRFIDEGVLYLKLNTHPNDMMELNGQLCTLLLDELDRKASDEQTNIFYQVLVDKPWLVFCIILRFTNIFDTVSVSHGD